MVYFACIKTSAMMPSAMMNASPVGSFAGQAGSLAIIAPIAIRITSISG
jgi:hypothetical protein